MNQKGGKIIGKGRYGCVSDILPIPSNPRCKYPKDGNNGLQPGNEKFLSKLMRKEDAEKEYKIFHDLISKIKNYKDFTLEVLNMCHIGDQQGRENDVKECKAITKFNINTSLYIKNGGKDIVYIVDNNKHNFIRYYQQHPKKFLLGLKRLFKGLKLLYENNIVHRDIKPQNILFNINNGNFNIIDFGLAAPADGIMYYLSGTYPTYIPGFDNITEYDEYSKTYDYLNDMYEHLKSGNKIERSDRIGGWLYRFISSFYRHNRAFMFNVDQIVELFNNNKPENEIYERVYIEYVNYLTDMYKANNKSVGDFIKSVNDNYYKTLDVYGMGIVVYIILYAIDEESNDPVINELKKLCKEMVVMTIRPTGPEIYEKFMKIIQPSLRASPRTTTSRTSRSASKSTSKKPRQISRSASKSTSKNPRQISRSASKSSRGRDICSIIRKNL